VAIIDKERTAVTGSIQGQIFFPLPLYFLYLGRASKDGVKPLMDRRRWLGEKLRQVHGWIGECHRFILGMFREYLVFQQDCFGYARNNGGIHRDNFWPLALAHPKANLRNSGWCSQFSFGRVVTSK
jgi:hypothetical protein